MDKVLLNVLREMQILIANRKVLTITSMGEKCYTIDRHLLIADSTANLQTEMQWQRRIDILSSLHAWGTVSGITWTNTWEEAYLDSQTFLSSSFRSSSVILVK